VKKIMIILLSLAGLSLFSVPNKIVEELGLSKEQQDKFDKIFMESETKNQEIMIQLDSKRLEMRKLFLKEESIDRTQLKKLMEEMSATEIELKLLRFDLDKAIFNILTPEQKQKYKIIRLKAFERIEKDRPIVRPEFNMPDNDKSKPGTKPDSKKTK
jgi:Spy/CpxP family protein refolding chaperone